MDGVTRKNRKQKKKNRNEEREVDRIYKRKKIKEEKRKVSAAQS